jgi:hypothetical protein
MPNNNPSFYHDTVELTIKLKLGVAAKLATYRREMHPKFTDEQVAAYLVRDALVGLGLLELPMTNRAEAAGER